MKNPIIDGMACALWANAWASNEEERGRTYPDQELIEITPPTPRHAFDAANNLAGRIEEINRRSLWALFAAANEADEKVKSGSSMGNKPEDFGHYLAMQSLGHGVSWFDDHARFEIKFPFYFEYNPLLEASSPEDLLGEDELKLLREAQGVIDFWDTYVDVCRDHNGMSLHEDIVGETGVWPGLREACEPYEQILAVEMPREEESPEP